MWSICRISSKKINTELNTKKEKPPTSHCSLSNIARCIFFICLSDKQINGSLCQFVTSRFQKPCFRPLRNSELIARVRVRIRLIRYTNPGISCHGYARHVIRRRHGLIRSAGSCFAINIQLMAAEVRGKRVRAGMAMPV